MNELIVKATPAVLDNNFAVIRRQLIEHLEKYQTEVVTEDTVKAAKTSATEINKLSGEIKAKVKSAIDEVSAPIAAFREQGKELEGICQSVRQGLLQQVAAFEEVTLRNAEAQLVALRDELYRAHGVEPEFQTVDITPKLTSLTATGKLTKAASDEVASAVDKCIVIQQRTSLRLSQLENECYRAGLHSPLTREHVEGVLFADEHKYQDALQGMIIRELDRQAETERRAAMAAEAKLRQERQSAEVPAQQAVEPARPAVVEPDPCAAPKVDLQPQDGGKVPVRVTCTFETSVMPTVSEASIEKEIRRVLFEAGIKTLKSVLVTKQASQGRAA